MAIRGRVQSDIGAVMRRDMYVLWESFQSARPAIA